LASVWLTLDSNQRPRLTDGTAFQSNAGHRQARLFNRLFMVFKKIDAKRLITGLLLILSCLFTLYIYILFAKSGASEIGNDDPRQSTYNLLVEGFRSGQLSLKREVPSGLVHLPDPYDPKANLVYRNWLTYRLHDTSLYRGKLYLYFGVTPAVLLFWPWAALTGHYLFHPEAVAIFCAIGFLINLTLLGDIKRRCFQNTPRWILIPLALALGLASGIPILLARADIWEVPIGCAYMLTSLTLTLTWFAIHQRAHRSWWLAAASLACGLAIGARPTAVFYAAALMVPVIFYLKENRGQKESRQVWKLFIAAIIPLAICGLGIATYNYLRFGRPLEFGQKYQLAGEYVAREKIFSKDYFLFNAKAYLFTVVNFTAHPPFVGKPAINMLHGSPENDECIFGILASAPIVWLVLALPLAWRGKTGEEKDSLRLFSSTVMWAFGSTLLFLCFFIGATGRYEVEFLPPCVLLSVISILGLEHIGKNRLFLRMAWSALLCFSAAFNVLYGMHIIASNDEALGIVLLKINRPALAANELYKAVAFAPEEARSRNELGIALAETGQTKEAGIEFMHAIEIDPGNTKYRENYIWLHRPPPACLPLPQPPAAPPVKTSP
jgi:tetratricopeptide (TPR) repeat protein